MAASACSRRGGNERLAGVDEERLATRTYGLALALIMAVALVLRLAAFGAIPAGLYHDEAYNGLDALRVLEGAHPLWFPANNGREPFFIYLVALSVGLLGRTVVAVRAPALLLGFLTVPATAFLGSSLFDRRVGLLSAAVTAIAFWPVHLSRIGFRAVALPFFLALALGFLWRGLRHGRRRDYVAAGLLYGASFYTYLAARFTPIPLALLGGLLLWPAAGLPRPQWRRLLLAAAVAAVVAAPLLAYMALTPGILMGRADQVSIFNPGISHGDPWGTLARNTVRALGAFFVRGDRIPRHNLPWRPIFDPALALAFLVGVGVAAKRRGAGWFTLLWVGAMLLPTILAEDAPHFLRGVGIQPLVFVLPALGLAQIWRWLERRKRPALGWCCVAAILLVGLASTGHDYLQRYAHDEAAYYFFESGATELAARINSFLQAGSPAAPRQAYISARLWQDWPSLRFLVPEGSAVQVVPANAPPAPAPATEALLAVWPFEPYQPALALLPRGVTIEVESDLYERGDLEPKARPLALVLRATRSKDGLAQAVFAGGISLIEGHVERVDAQHLRARLVWEAEQPQSVDYTVFVQVLCQGNILGQHDGPPAGGVLPTTLWRAGDRVVDLHEVTLQAPYNPQTERIIVGLYNLATMVRLPVIESSAPAAGDAVPLALP